MPLKKVRCSNCGAPTEAWAGDRAPYSCGELECERELREALQIEDAERRERAERDNYERY
jgi:hypothetical protein